MKKLAVFLAATVLLTWSSAIIVSAATKPVQEPKEVLQVQSTPPAKSASTAPAPGRPTSPQAYQLNWLSINGGGAINASSTNYQLGLSVGQSVAGFATSSSYQMGIGFWYGAPSGGLCLAAKGDMNGMGGITPADAVLMLNCVFLGVTTGTAGNDCNLCYSDMNCVGGLTPADAVIHLQYVFLAISPPC